MGIPSTFNFQDFKKLPAPSGLPRVFQAYSTMALGAGMARSVWKFSMDGKSFALKIVINGRIEQNKKEIERSKCTNNSPYFTQIVQFDEKNFF
jgi:hypothetical protein